MRNYTKDALLGVAVGDALGVPAEFRSREDLKENPVTDMTGFGTHSQPSGTWSDDSSLTFCLAHSLLKGYNLGSIATNFVDWKEKALWTPFGEVFDIGLITSKSIDILSQIVKSKDYSELKFMKDFGTEHTNGSGSLMRILPLLFYIKDKPLIDQFNITYEVSALTHGHIRAALACQIYLTLAFFILQGEDKFAAYKKMQEEIKKLFTKLDIHPEEQFHFNRVIKNDISKYPERIGYSI